MWRLRTVSLSAVRVSPREHENAASVNMCEVLFFTCAEEVCVNVSVKGRANGFWTVLVELLVRLLVAFPTAA